MLLENSLRPLSKNRESGMTLVEVMVAATILAISVSALTIMIGNSDVLGMESDHYRQARIIAQHELEDPWSHFLQYDDGAHSSEDIYLDPQAPERDTLRARDNVAKSTIVQGDLGDGVKIPFRTVQVAISWTERSGKARSLTLRKRITKVQ
jgi:prepilin-type N-terminal cleavage/methylation domain-containing protein